MVEITIAHLYLPVLMCQQLAKSMRFRLLVDSQACDQASDSITDHRRKQMGTSHGITTILRRFEEERH